MHKLQLIKSVALAVGLIIILNLFFNIGVKTFYPSLKFENFCSNDLQKKYDSKEQCEAIGGKWTEQYYGDPVFPQAVPMDKNFQSYCDPFHTCNTIFKTANDLYNRNVFIILVVAGFIALGIGLQMTAVAAVSLGFVWGGVLSLVIGTIRYWSGMQDYLRFIILGIVLVVLVVIGYKKMQK